MYRRRKGGERGRRERGRRKGEKQEREEEWEGRRGQKCAGRRGGGEADGKWIIRKAWLEDNLYFINAEKLHYCSHAQSYCPHSKLRPGGEARGKEGSTGDKKRRRHKII